MMTRHGIHLPTVVLIGLLAAQIVHAQSSDFYGYYTKIDSGEPWELHSLTGKHADVVVHVGELGDLIFWRASSYLPHFKSAGHTWYFDELVERRGDGTDRMPDRINQYSYVRIIENTPQRVVVHWRYMPEFLADPDLSITMPEFGKVQFPGVVHEVFTITPDGTVTRTVRRGREKLDEFLDPGNVTTQTLKLTPQGIEQVSLKEARLTHPAREPIAGAPVKDNVVGSPAVHFRFDEALEHPGDQATDDVTGSEAVIRGHKSIWKKGVSGTALGFDGYFAEVALPAAQAPKVDDAVTIEAWVAPGAYSVCKWSALVHHSSWQPVVNNNFIFDGIEWGERQLDERLTAGYFLGIDEFGHVGFQVMADGQIHKLACEQTLDLYQWTHVAATFGNGQMRLYINGKLAESTEAAGRIAASDGKLLVGANDDRITYIPNHTVRPYSAFPSRLGFEGLIDEPKVYTTALSAADIARSYAATRPQNLAADLEPRVLPGQPADIPQRFGAYYTKLKYHDLWDNMWRTSDWPDIVVKFDDMPTSIVFWRGTRYGANYVTENNRWIGDQSIELTDWRWDNKPTGCNSTCEHMMDAQCRFSHVRVIENTAARVVVHWRYSSMDVNYKHPNWDRTHNWGVWTDEYYTIYPDGTAIRAVQSNGSIDYYFATPQSIHFTAVQVLFQAGTTPEDNLHENALTLANISGDTADVDLATAQVDRPIRGANIEMFNLRSDYKVYLAFQQPDPQRQRFWARLRQQEAVEEEEVEEDEDEDVDGGELTEWEIETARWASSWEDVGLKVEWGEGIGESDFVTDSELLIGPWNHWPVSQFLCDGRNITAPDRMSSAELSVAAHGDASSMMMLGLTNQPITSLIPKVKAWNHPAPVYNAGRARSHGYDKAQLAYVFTMLSDSVFFTLGGSPETPIVNPGLVFKNWRNRTAKARVRVNDRQLQPGRDFRQGIITDTDGTATMIIWLNWQSTRPALVEIEQHAG